MCMTKCSIIHITCPHTSTHAYTHIHTLIYIYMYIHTFLYIYIQTLFVFFLQVAAIQLLQRQFWPGLRSQAEPERHRVKIQPSARACGRLTHHQGRVRERAAGSWPEPHLRSIRATLSHGKLYIDRETLLCVSMYLSIHLSINLSIHLFVCLYVYLFTYLFIYLSG